MEKEEIIKKIIDKKEFKELRRVDVLKAYSLVEHRNFSDEKKIKLTRDLLRKVFSAFINPRVFSFGKRGWEDVLKKHKSTRERFESYEIIYERIFKRFEKKERISLVDLGAGVNGFSVVFLKNLGYKISYFGVESVGQLVKLMNDFFKKDKFDAKAIHLSLFELDEVAEVVKSSKGPKVIFLMKAIDSLEMVERDYSKKLISHLASLCSKEDFFVVSFATESLIKRTKFKAKRYWIYNYINDNYNLVDDFEISGERYLVFSP